MAQVLDRKGEFPAALSKYLLVCDATENVIKVNPGARVDMKWVLLSLDAIAKIYERREDHAKSVPFRECLIGFLNQIKDGGESALEDATLEDFDAVTTGASAYGQLFEKVHAAAALPEEPCESTPDLLRMVAEEQQKKKEERVERMVEMLDQKHKEKVQEIQSSFWKRNAQRALRHPIITGLLITAVCLLLVYYVTHKPKKASVPDDEYKAFAEIERELMEKWWKSRKRVPTASRGTPRPTPTLYRWGSDALDL
jgi:hypothetical protein